MNYRVEPRSPGHDPRHDVASLRPPRTAIALLAAALAGAGTQVATAGQPALRLAQQDTGDDGGDASGLVLRIGRLEEQIRSLTGQVEQLQFQNRRLDENLRKMQADVDFRFQDLQHGGGAPAPAPVRAPAQRQGSAAPPAPDAPLAAEDDPGTLPASPAAPPPTRPAQPRRVGDAFDPSLDPNAPGAPRPLGTTTPSQPLASPRVAARTAADDPRAPLDLMQRPAGGATPASPAAPAASAPAVIPAPAAAPRDPNAVASLAPGGTREEYDATLGLYKQGQYDGAANGFQAFAEKYPRDRLVPEAVYLAGDSYARLGRHREAAEQFLKVSTDYGKSPRAPDALLRLGMSLSALGAKDQACATYQEVTRRYPAASTEVRAAVDRETRRARCPGNG